ncbi:MAG: DUF1926 domain-containing protein [Candidatus Omnitrophica bacterium]|nr:DUF1926 domain-containing protein [Candidatus Omnitrophota bacterium]
MPGPVKKLVFCVHAHQPIGNFDHVFNEAYEKSYRPFFDVVEKHPKVKVTAHFSGSLIDWLCEKKPEFIEKLKRLNSRGQIEFLGGGYYEPIYGAIPERDILGQIRMMREKLKTLFGVDPEGAWLTERVWDPELTAPLAKAGVRFTILDDLHFEQAGIEPPITHYYRASEGKYAVDLFASSKNLRYLMPFHKAQETLDYLHSLKTGGDNVVVFADDCEKFGMWPGTYHWVYEEGWLDQFFKLAEKDKTVQFSFFKEVRAQFGPKEEVHVPHGSYSEMMEWSAGRFYNFFEKYPESLYMKNRMWEVSRRVEGRKEALPFLYRAQCNCAYWHGVFGGLYLHHLRAAIFQNLIEAEKRVENGGRVESLEHGKRWVARQKNAAWFFNAQGACLEELDYLPKPANLMCNLRRYAETYHRALQVGVGMSEAGQTTEHVSIHEMLGTKEKGLERHLHYDPYPRLSFMEHFFEEPIDVDVFRKAEYPQIGDFADGVYEVKDLVFQRKGSLHYSDETIPLQLKKTVVPQGDGGIQVQYQITNLSQKEIRFVWGVEFNFSIGEAEAMKGLSLQDISEHVFLDSWRGISIGMRWDGQADLLAAPIETVSGSEGGMERTVQQLAVLRQERVSLKPGEAFARSIWLDVGEGRA